MKTGIFLSYKGLGANLLHLSYCHEISKKFGPITLITLNPKLKEVLNNDPNIEEIIYLDNFYKKFFDIYSLSKFLKNLKLDNLFIFYPSLRYFLSAKMAGIKKIFTYPFFNKKNLHLVKAAKEFTEKCLNLNDCPTETKIYVDKNKNGNSKNNDKKKIILGIGSSGPTTKWGYKNYTKLIKKLNELKNFHFYLLCGPDENNDAKEIINEIGSNCESLSQKSILEIKDYIHQSDIYVGNDSFGHHISCQMGKPSFVILLDTPRAYSDYSVNQNRILPPNINLDEITHDSKLDPNSITVEMILDKIKKFI
ncbi:MAG: glycosyltransferase family 9 protein [Candidatus Pelagibacter sp.]